MRQQHHHPPVLTATEKSGNPSARADAVACRGGYSLEARWRGPGLARGWLVWRRQERVQYEFFANEAERRLPDWKKQNNLDRAGTISRAYEGYGDASTETRVSNARKWLQAYRERSEQAALPVFASPTRATPAPYHLDRDPLMLLGDNLKRLGIAISQTMPIQSSANTSKVGIHGRGGRS
jgi:hypothetical protein